MADRFDPHRWPLRILLALACLLGALSDANAGLEQELVLEHEGRAPLHIHYIANEGVRIECDGTQILLDALMEGLKRPPIPYEVPARAIQEKLAAAEPPFDDTDLILVSHYHYDHFHPQMVLNHLQANPGARLISCPQVLEDLRGLEGAPLDRMEAVPYREKERQDRTVGHVRVSFLGLSHGVGRFTGVQNNVQRIELGGWSLLHLGDADMDLRNYEGLEFEAVDVALVPEWYLRYDPGPTILDRLNARQLVAIHVQWYEVSRTFLEIQELWPEAIVFAWGEPQGRP